MILFPGSVLVFITKRVEEKKNEREQNGFMELRGLMTKKEKKRDEWKREIFQRSLFFFILN